jgi:hypothetical protein
MLAVAEVEVSALAVEMVILAQVVRVVEEILD